jgi:hypothetical protein
MAGLVFLIVTARPPSTDAQSRPEGQSRAEGQSSAPAPGQSEVPLYRDIGLAGDRWELSLETRIGLPQGSLRVGERSLPVSHLRLHEDLGVDVSEAIEGSVAFHFTERDAIRLKALYYFLDGGSLFQLPIGYNGDTFGPGHVHVNADFYRLGLMYERLLSTANALFVTGSAGLTYVHLNPTLSSHGHSNSEDFYLQELPVPIVGVRLDVPMGPRFTARATVEAGGLPKVDSGRTEGGTVFLDQAHADLGLGITYAMTSHLLLELGYHFTYFWQHEHSHEDDNSFELRDNAFRVGLSFAF